MSKKMSTAEILHIARNGHLENLEKYMSGPTKQDPYTQAEKLAKITKKLRDKHDRVEVIYHNKNMNDAYNEDSFETELEKMAKKAKPTAAEKARKDDCADPILPQEATANLEAEAAAVPYNIYETKPYEPAKYKVSKVSQLKTPKFKISPKSSMEPAPMAEVMAMFSEAISANYQLFQSLVILMENEKQRRLSAFIKQLTEELALTDLELAKVLNDIAHHQLSMAHMHEQKARNRLSETMVIAADAANMQLSSFSLLDHVRQNVVGSAIAQINDFKKNLGGK